MLTSSINEEPGMKKGKRNTLEQEKEILRDLDRNVLMDEERLSDLELVTLSKESSPASSSIRRPHTVSIDAGLGTRSARGCIHIIPCAGLLPLSLRRLRFEFHHLNGVVPSIVR